MTNFTAALAWRPEWPVTAGVGAIWIALLTMQWSGSHALHALSPIANWTVMSAAMMVPTVLPALRHVAFNSLRVRRCRAMLVFLAAYLLAWMVFGIAALTADRVLRGAGSSTMQLLVACLLLAAAWQLTPIKRRAIFGCRRSVPLPPTGWKADEACARFAIWQAVHCIVVCWPAMLTMAVVGHQVTAMIAFTALLIAEDQAPGRRHLLMPAAGAFAAAAIALMFV
jgi:predicted metal-binding membrane protein